MTSASVVHRVEGIKSNVRGPTRGPLAIVCRQEVKERESQTHAIGWRVAPSFSGISFLFLPLPLRPSLFLSLSLLPPLSLSLRLLLSVFLAPTVRERRRGPRLGPREKDRDIWYSPAAVERVQCRSWSKKAGPQRREIGRSVSPGGDGAVWAGCYSRFVFLFRLQFLSIYAPRSRRLACSSSRTSTTWTPCPTQVERDRVR